MLSECPGVILSSLLPDQLGDESPSDSEQSIVQTSFNLLPVKASSYALVLPIMSLWLTIVPYLKKTRLMTTILSSRHCATQAYRCSTILKKTQRNVLTGKTMSCFSTLCKTSPENKTKTYDWLSVKPFDTSCVCIITHHCLSHTLLNVKCFFFTQTSSHESRLNINHWRRCFQVWMCPINRSLSICCVSARTHCFSFHAAARASCLRYVLPPSHLHPSPDWHCYPKRFFPESYCTLSPSKLGLSSDKEIRDAPHRPAGHWGPKRRFEEVILHEGRCGGNVWIV